MPLDCIVIGFNDADVGPMVESRRRMGSSSGAFRQMLGSVFRYQDRWIHHVNLLNAAIHQATGQDTQLNTMELPGLAVCYLASYLKRHGFEVDLVNFFNKEKPRLAELLAGRPRMVAVTTTFYVEPDPVREVVRFVREHCPDTCVVVGGPYVQTICDSGHEIAQDFVFDRIGADIYVNDAQGEAALAALLQPGSEAARIPNLIIRDGSSSGRASFTRNPREREDNDMDGEAIDWELVPANVYTPTAQMFISRSCPFRCSFCRYPTLAGPVRLASVETIERQMKQLKAHGVRTLVFPDDTPNVPVPRFKAILKMMIENDFGFSWFSNLRCANADEEVFDLLEPSGCKGVFLGIESGDQTILENMNKRATVEAYRDGIRRLKDSGILTYCSFIIGFPGETEESVQNTIRFIQETQPDYYQVHLYYHSKQVPIQEQAGEFGLKGSDYTWQHATMDWQRAADLVDEVRDTVDGPLLCTSYVSSFWMIAYLYGLGVSSEHIHAFVEASKPVLMQNRLCWEKGEDPSVSQFDDDMLEAARAIAGDLE